MELIFDVLNEWVLIAILNENLDVLFIFLWSCVAVAERRLRYIEKGVGEIENASVNFFEIVKKNGNKL